MSQWSALKRIWRMSCRIQKLSGGFRGRYFFDAVRCGYRHQASPENYFVLRFFKLSDRERASYLTSGRSAAADRILNQKMTEEDDRIMAQKPLLYEKFAGLLNRKWRYLPQTSYEEYEQFLDRQECFIAKPGRGIMGRGIRLIKTAEIADRKAFYEECKAEKMLIEERIVQHEQLENISPGCVNSVRINMARDQKEKAQFIGACLKCGGQGALADNFHSGGVAYPLDLTSGEIIGPGRNNTDLCEYTHHPGTEVPMKGMRIPHWEAVCELAEKAMERMPRIGYVGWDIAVTREGAELIEGNCHWPGGNIIQLDGVGKYPLVKKCMEE